MHSSRQCVLNQTTGVFVVMGVSGCGKSTVASYIAGQLALPFLEADSLHPASNIQKMSRGIPLTDADRLPWLEVVRDESSALVTSHGACVVACSALKLQYRNVLRAASGQVRFIHLQGSFDTIHHRMSARTAHFMPGALLQSQFDTLEDPCEEYGVVVVSIEHEPERIAGHACELLNATAADTAQ